MPAAWELSSDTPKLLIGLPHKNLVSLEWSLAFRNLVVNVPSIFTCSAGVPIDVARNEIVKSALTNNVDWIFFLDTDVVPPPDIITRLMAHNLPIVTAIYHTRAPPIEPCIWREVHPSGKQAIAYTQGQMIEADFIGMGACLIHTSVFKNIFPPFFDWTLGRQEPNNMTLGRSEDFEFCKKVRDKGYKIWADTSIQCRHGISNAHTFQGAMGISQI